ncbi:MAG: hypothetical protein DHS20C17_01240 [Cyclobacteriaceae bacterium]|nr:MAG: hypothetical protein DHS20C17_01240 [Cyclobacteriaceae bacterium]
MLAQDLEGLLKNADEYYQNEQFHTAAEYYQIAYGLQANNPETNYRLARSYHAVFDYAMAAFYYDRALTLDPTAYPLAAFYLAQMQKSMGNFKKARDSFQRFIKNNNTTSFIPAGERENYIKQAEIEIEGSTWAIEQLGKSWREMGFNLMPEPVNSPSNDYSAVAPAHGSTITITSGRKEARGGLVDNRFGEHFTDNFRFTQENDQWVRADISDRFDRTNTKYSDGVGSYNTEGDKYYFTSCYEGNAYCKLYVTYQENGVWKNPRLLNEAVNAPGYDNKHPTLTSGGDTLIFVSNRPGGPGGNDIWFSISSDGENWQTPKPLPGKVNTPFNEASPFCFKDNLLFFSSEGHAGIGGMDVFMAKDYQNDNGSIQNLGTPFNSGYDDSFFSLSGSTGYVSSNRPGGLGKFDIYTFRVPEKSENVHQYLEESADGTQLRSRIRSNDGSNLFASRDEDQFYYDNLSPDDKARLERILAMRNGSEGTFKSSDLSKDDFKYYNKLDIATKATIERLAMKRTMELEGHTAGTGLTLQEKLDWEYYQNIADDEKEIIDRILNAKVVGRQMAMDQLSKEAQQYSVDPVNRERIESKVQLESLNTMAARLSDQYRQSIEKLNSTSADTEKEPVSQEYVNNRAEDYDASIRALGPEIYHYYQGLSPSRRADIHQSVWYQYIISSQHLNTKEKSTMLSSFGLEADPLVVAPGSTTEEYNISEVRKAIQQNLANQFPGQASKLQIEKELIAQRMMLQQEIDQLSKNEAVTLELQQQMKQFIDEQQEASDPELEAKIVEQFYRQWYQLPPVTPRASYYFNSLSPGHQLRIERLAMMVYKETGSRELQAENDFLATQQAADQWYYLELSPSDQGLVDEIVSRGWNPSEPYTDQQLDFISNLTKLERERIDRYMGNQPAPNFEEQDDQHISIFNSKEDQSTEKHSKDQTDIITRSESGQPVQSISTYSSTRIYFDFDRYQLRPEARKTLDEIVAFINQSGKTTKVEIEGHTDNIGSESYNRELGRKRSLSAANFLQPNLDQATVSASSLGELNPEFDNRTRMGRQMNRRVALKIAGISFQSQLVTYLLKPNVTLSVLAEATGISKDQIINWNGLSTEQLRSYQPIRLPASLNIEQFKSFLFLPPDDTSEKNVIYHTVNRGENLFRLAQRYHTTVQTLEELNNLSASDLMAGQQLRVR